MKKSRTTRWAAKALALCLAGAAVFGCGSLLAPVKAEAAPTIEATPTTGSITINKKAETADTPLAGATFTIYQVMSLTPGANAGNYAEYEPAAGFESVLADVEPDDLGNYSATQLEGEDVTQVHSSIENAAPVLKVRVDPVKAQAEGLTPATIGSTIYTRLSGVTATTMRVNNEDIDVIVEFADDQYKTVDQLEAMLITTGTGTQVPLSTLADIVYEDSPSQIVRRDERYQVSITMQPNLGYEDTASVDVRTFVSGWQFDGGVEMAANALDESTAEEMGALVQALVTAIFLIFIAMAIQFESPKFSLMIMITIPLSLIGAFGLLFLFDSPISMTSMLGFLMMVGNVVNGGILYVETANQYRDEMPLDKALVEAGATRLRPILMTVTITVVSELPNVLAYGESGETMQGSALVNVGGLLASTALMLLMMPTFYRKVHNLGLKHLSDPR